MKLMLAGASPYSCGQAAFPHFLNTVECGVTGLQSPISRGSIAETTRHQLTCPFFLFFCFVFDFSLFLVR